MADETERIQILRMVERGQVTAQEGARLLAALAIDGEPEPTPPAAGPSRLRVRVIDLETGRSKVDLNIPLSLVPVGLRLGAHFVPEGSDVDLGALLRRVKDEGLQGKIADIEDAGAGERVELLVE